MQKELHGESIYKKGSVAYLNNVALYQKVDDEYFGLWVALNSTYVVEEIINNEKIYHLHKESEKPLFKKDGSLNRFGFKWSDDMIQKTYKIENQ